MTMRTKAIGTRHNSSADVSPSVYASSFQLPLHRSSLGYTDGIELKAGKASMWGGKNTQPEHGISNFWLHAIHGQKDPTPPFPSWSTSECDDRTAFTALESSRTDRVFIQTKDWLAFYWDWNMIAFTWINKRKLFLQTLVWIQPSKNSLYLTF